MIDSILKKKIDEDEKNISFSNDIIQEFKIDSLEEKFIIEEYWCDDESINVFDIVGTIHPDYINLTWKQLLDRGKRMHINLPLVDKNPDYYIKPIKEPTMYFNKIDGKYYINTDGNHRSAIVKFLFYFNGNTHIHGVTVNEYKIDKISYEKVKKLKQLIKSKKLPILLEVNRTSIKREDTARWKRDIFKISFEFQNLKTGKSFEFPDIQLNNIELDDLIKTVENYSLFKKLFFFNTGYMKYL